MSSEEHQQDGLTTIGLRHSVKRQLDAFRVGDESYNSVIRRLLQRQEIPKETSDRM